MLLYSINILEACAHNDGKRNCMGTLEIKDENPFGDSPSATIGITLVVGDKDKELCTEERVRAFLENSLLIFDHFVLGNTKPEDKSKFVRFVKTKKSPCKNARCRCFTGLR